MPPKQPPLNNSSDSPLTGHSEAIGQSQAFLDFQERLGRVAPVERPVLLMGERGTGKEMAARRLHFLSKRWGQPFVPLNCAALSPTLIESELFGHEEGAFTGARGLRKGRFEAADKGTLFLDEISLIPIETQEKILRVVEYGAFERVGSTKPIQVDVRIIGATNVDLSREAAQGRFKRDLLDRLSFEVVFLPPLRNREEDILVLAHHFASRMAFELGREEIPQFTPEALGSLTRHRWPGNVRELKNVVERAVYRCEGAVISELDFDPFRPLYDPLAPEGAAPREENGLAHADVTGPSEGEKGIASVCAPPPSLDVALESLVDHALAEEQGFDLAETLQRMESLFLEKSLSALRYNQRLAAAKLGLTYHQFRGLYRKHISAGRDKTNAVKRKS